MTEMLLVRDTDGFLICDVSDLGDYLPFEIHNAKDDTWETIEDDSALIDWGSDIDLKPKYDKIRYDEFNVNCTRYRKIFEGWDDLSFEERRDRINQFRCGL